MKKLLLTALVMMAATSSFAANTGTLYISGTVEAINDITVDNKNVNLKIEAGETGVSVATVTEVSNNYGGYSISMKSANGLSKLVNGASSTDYQVSYAGGAYKTLTGVDQEVKSATGNLTAKSTAISDVSVKVTAKPGAPAGTYSDTIHITMNVL